MDSHKGRYGLAILWVYYGKRSKRKGIITEGKELLFDV